MILQTTVEWTQDKKLSKEESEKLKAKREVLGDEYDSYEDQDLLYEETVKNAIIDTNENKLYVEISEGRICMTHLLGCQYICTIDNNLQTVTEKLYFESTLDEIKEKLNENIKQNLKKWQ